MNPDLFESMVRHEGCRNAELCIRCVRPLRQTSLTCQKCKTFSYCSNECLEKDIPRHQPLCDALRSVFLKVASSLNDGELIRVSPMEVLETYFRELKQESFASMNSDDMNSLISHDTQNSVHDTQNSVSTDFQVTIRSQCSSARVNGNDNQCSSAGVSDSQTKVPDSFGKGWWGKNKDSSKKFKQENRSKHVPSNDMILGEKNATNKSTNISSSSSHGAGSNSAGGHSAQNQSSDSQDFSSYNANSHDAITNREDINSPSNPITNREGINSPSNPITNREDINRASKPIANIPNRGSPNMKASKSGKSDLHAPKSKCNPSSSQTSNTADKDTFGSGWWQVRKPSKLNTPSSSTNQQALLNPDNSESKQKNQNRAINTNSSSKATVRETSKNSSRTTASIETKEHSDTSDFGSGWWKHRFVNNGTRKTNPTESTKNSIATNRNKPEEAKHLSSNNTPEFVNKCTDVMPYTILFSLEQMVRFSKVVSRIGSGVVEEEAMHGRILTMALIHVPGVGKASLGGSRVSLLLEIIGRYPSAMLGILARDKFGHKAPVLINIESSMYTVPNTDYKIPYSDCIKPGNFIILRAVYWEQLPNGKLAIVMRDITNLNFIFYDHLA